MAQAVPSAGLAQPDYWSSVLKAAHASKGYCRTIQDIQKQTLRIQQEEEERRKKVAGSAGDSEPESDALSDDESGSGSDEDEEKDDNASSTNGSDEQEKTQDTQLTQDFCCMRPDLQPSYGYSIPWNQARYELSLPPPPLPIMPSRTEDAETKSVAPSTSSSTRKKKQQQRVGLLEAIFAPGPAKRTAAIRPHVSGKQTRTPPLKEEAEGSVAGSVRAKASTSSKTKAAAPKPKRQNSGGLLSSLLGPAPPPDPKKDPRRLVKCTICLSDDLPALRSAKLECGHRMCHSCLKRLFVLSTTDPQLMPPRCCTDTCIPLRHVERILSNELKKTWNAKYAEYTTKDRLYCPARGCGSWIAPKHIHTDRTLGRRYGVCSKCKAKVCKRCGAKWHGSRHCGENDRETRRVIDMGVENGWQRCHSCRAMVQLAEGCNHMKCRCKAEFCMCCGAKWKTCDCPWFNVPPERFEFGGPGGDGWPAPDLFDVRRYRVFDDDETPPPRPNGNGTRQNRRVVEIPTPPMPIPFLPFRDRRDAPLDPLNVPNMFRPADLPPPPPPHDYPAAPPQRPPRRSSGTRSHPPLDRRRTRSGGRLLDGFDPAALDDRHEQETADEAFARQLQEEERQRPRLDRTRTRSGRMLVDGADPAVHDDLQRQEAADEAFARQLQDQEFDTDFINMDTVFVDLSLLDGPPIEVPDSRTRSARERAQRRRLRAAVLADEPPSDPVRVLKLEEIDEDTPMDMGLVHRSSAEHWAVTDISSSPKSPLERVREENAWMENLREVEVGEGAVEPPVPRRLMRMSSKRSGSGL